MKKLITYGFISLISWTCFYDLTNGSLHFLHIARIQAAQVKQTTRPELKTIIPYKKITIEPGDTVLSILESINASKKTNISKMIGDFQNLNPHTDPNTIKIGETYLFPLY